MKQEDGRSPKEIQVELKYCERCGGLWLRPVGGRQVYCVACAQAVAQLPPPSKEPGTARMCQGPQWNPDSEDGMYQGDEDSDLDATGGVA